MFKLAYSPIDKIIDLKKSITNDQYFDLIIAFGDLDKNWGTFSPIDNKNRFCSVVDAYRQELPCHAFYGLVDGDLIKFGDILLGLRDQQRYIFRIPLWHQLNDLIEKKIDLIDFPLELNDGSVYSFYFILGQADLNQFINLFYDWLSTTDSNIDD